MIGYTFGRLYPFLVGLVLVLSMLMNPICSLADEKTGKSTDDSVVLNFENAELYEIIRAFADILKINYMVEGDVRGKITIRTSGSLQKEDLFSIFFQILEANGLTITKEGSLYRIIKLKDAPRLPIDARFGKKVPATSPDQKIIIQIVPLKYISDSEMTKLLSPFASSHGTLISHKESRSLIIIDKGINIRKMLKMVEAFDVDYFDKIHHRFYRTEHVKIEDIGTELKSILDSYGGTIAENIKIVPLDRLNTLLVFSRDGLYFEKIEGLIEYLDVPQEEDDESQIFVYFVKNSKADELAGLLNSVFSGKDSEKDEKSKSSAKTKDKKEKVKRLDLSGSSSSKKKQKTKAGKAGNQISSSLKGEVRITPDETRNAMIIQAIPSDYRLVENVLNLLDVLPRQVLIEVTVAEVSLNGKTELGVEWSYKQGMGSNLSTSLMNAGMGAGGFQYTIGQATRWTQALKALATDSKINILSSPSILASDNKEARINVSTEVPVASTQYQNTSDTTPILQTNIQYRNTGQILSVTPHINENGLVSLDVSFELSEQSDAVQVGTDSMPSFFKRSANTSLTVGNGQTIVIGGLIRENKNYGMSGVPCLGQIPLLKFLFGKWSESNNKTELIILITPQVIAKIDEIDMITNQFRDRVRNALEGVENVTRPSGSKSGAEK